ncbi:MULTISPECIES: Holliday junction branch migration protein RuvA [Streptococcus]|uniref:Holliday junction branch migration complex subunit RuvA n=1 Tax=Streptococcus ruminantium TaxID=1917441 RepID=A0ABU1B2R1_9STRE|nr:MULTISPECIES: Holliday junction branch migration protein RuvA [Streptococcus]MDQ8759585.1 Holliday junction branch migration protein RuvA [Streptococcus ruminantium]MDQ8764914.1 Holliday junction branch migration protein RuvA [Streptococcus ruminantium]MDQ8768612.1 Holliday junction branch migration protein RuvA [Streptococcus ruminantium]MDQ8775012.1 Holliday junction branch migration protein RuvA [Streptococcus ruminantium]MDQ8779373.1 Holliday junction branch migration protein RuvA [Stre
MYDYIKGILTKITAKYVVVEANGIGYILQVANPYAYSGQVQQPVTVYTHQVIREDAHLLYGFATEMEKSVFLSLISVSGIGPTTALAIIAVDDNDGLVRAIEQKNITYLTKFPKIGKKTAQQMILDLEGKFVMSEEMRPAQPTVAVNENIALEEAMEAMEALGYRPTELKKIKKFFEGTSDTAENYIKSALKMLMK